MKKILLFTMLILSNINWANCSLPSYCSRSCWDPSGTRVPKENPSSTNVTHIIVHHTGDNSVFPTNTDYKQVMRYYYDLHTNTNGWSDIGYNWLIDRNGIIYEGRGDGIQGSHFSGQNSGTMGVALIGNFILETPSANALNSLEKLVAWEATDKNINVTSSSFHASSGRTLNNISGHLDGGSTACPGTNLYSKLPSIRTNVSNLSCYSGGSSNFPDLVIERLWTEPSNPKDGEVVDLYVEIKNVGSQTANSISLDYKINNSTVGNDTHSSLTPNETRTEYFNNYVFSNSGNFNYCVYINAVTNEQNTNNNSYCITVNVGSSSSGGNDFYISNPSLSQNVIEAGGTLTASAEQCYSGNTIDANLDTVYLGYYLSTNTSLDSSDILLDYDLSSLGSDDPCNNESQSLQIPSTTNSGTYYILFVTDYRNQFTETNENNNIEFIQITINNTMSIVDNEFKNQISIYPNPSSQYINIKSTTDVSITNLKLYDLNGRLVKNTSGKNLNKLDISNLPKGIYLLTIVSFENKRATIKVLKE